MESTNRACKVRERLGKIKKSTIKNENENANSNPKNQENFEFGLGPAGG